jgi:hypothetical protein
MYSFDEPLIVELRIALGRKEKVAVHALLGFVVAAFAAFTVST